MSSFVNLTSLLKRCTSISGLHRFSVGGLFEFFPDITFSCLYLQWVRCITAFPYILPIKAAIILKNTNRLFVLIGLIVLIIAGRFLLAQNEVTEIPDVTVVTIDQEIDAVRGSYCWHSAGEGVCVDMAAPHELIKERNTPFIKVQPGELMEFQYSQNVTNISIQQWLQDHEYKEIATTIRFHAPLEKGKYIISSLARFSSGDVTDSIAIEVE